MKELKIISNTFSFLIVILFIFIINYIYPIMNNYGYVFGIIIASFINGFWRKPLYIENININNEVIHIKYLNPFLKAGEVSYNMKEISNINIVKNNFFRRNGRIEFKHNNSIVEYDFLNSKKEMVNAKFKNIINKQTTHNIG